MNTEPKVYISDGTGNLPLGDLKELQQIEGNIEEEFDIQEFAKEHTAEFSVNIRQSALRKIFLTCYGQEPYRKLKKCAMCHMKEDCIKEKIENNFNRR